MHTHITFHTVIQTNCIKCTRALNKNIREHNGNITYDQIGQFLMKHKGTCYRNSNLSPASAEEPQAAIAARDMILDKDGHYLGDNVAVFALNCNSDNDTRAAEAIAREQNAIIGSVADNLTSHRPDGGHVMKATSSSMFALRKKDRSFNGANCLSNMRIKSITRDIRKTIDHYTEVGVGDPVARRQCLDQIYAIIPHQCGEHHQCVNERFCTYLRVKKRNPDWRDGQIRTAAYHESTRALRGKNMSLHSRGQEILVSLLRKRFNEKTIDKIAEDGCSNLSESFWNMNTKFSEGKRLNQDHTDHWEVTNKLTFCRVGEGNIEKTHSEVSRQLSLKVTSPEFKQQTKSRKIRLRIKNYQKTAEFKDARSFAKATKDQRMGKVDAKKAHRSDKVPLSETIKKETKSTGDERKKPTCSICKLGDHNASKCKLPRDKKRCHADLLDFDIREF
jgi:hypothetical protein